jgi:nuclear GTP-binding protein
LFEVGQKPKLFSLFFLFSMVAKKHKSKRQKASHKYKVIKKVNEHRRKVRKAAKDKPHKKRKDPGMPTNLPFKDEVLAQAHLLKQQDLEEKLLRKQKQAQESEEVEFEQTPAKPVAAKRSYKLFKDIIETVDIVLEVVDSRDLTFGRALEVENLVLKAKKKLILVASKSDSIPSQCLNQWVTQLSDKVIVLPFSTRVATTESVKVLHDMVKDLTKELKKEVVLGIVGYPNSGKNGLLTALQSSEMNVLPHVGIMFSKTTDPELSSQVLLRNFSKGTKVSDPVKAVEAVISRFKAEQLCQHYKIPPYLNSQDLLTQVARVKHLVRRQGHLDTVSAARAIIQDWYDGKFAQHVELVPSENKFESKGKFKLNAEVKFLLAAFDSADGLSISSVGSVPVDLEMSVLPKGYVTLKDEDLVSEDEDEDDDHESYEDMEEDAEDTEEDDEDENADVKQKKSTSIPVYSDEAFEFE